MGKTSIAWCDHTINPIRARDIKTGAVGHYCKKLSAGCKNCFASKLQSRFRMPSFSDVGTKDRRSLNIFLDPAKLREVLVRKQPTVFFWEDMSDLFGEWVLDRWLDSCLATMALTPQHTHLLLTKRIGRAAEYLRTRPLKKIAAASDVLVKRYRIDRPAGANWPLPNVRLGTSVEDQKTADLRIPTLFTAGIAVNDPRYFLSIEPQLGPVTIKWAACSCPDKPEAFRLGHQPSCAVPRLVSLLDLVIVGGEGIGARPNNLQWTRSILRQCEELGVPAFVKQLGSFPTYTPIGTEAFRKKPTKIIKLKLQSRKGEDPAEWPEDLQVRQPARSGAW